jgi:TfoX/Sxy family transcriptional regulator of competence genes
MGYDENLAGRVRALLLARTGVVEKKMFGGLCFMVEGAMCCGVLGSDLIVRVGPERYEEALAQPGARPFDFTGRPSKGTVFVAPQGTGDRAVLARWLRRSLDYVESSASNGKRAVGRSKSVPRSTARSRARRG